MSSDAPLLTAAQLREWERRMAEISESIRAQTEEMTTLSRKIDAAKAYMETIQVDGVLGDLIDPDNVDRGAVDHPTTPDESISETVLVAVKAVKAPAKAMAIRKWIEANNPAVCAKLTANPAYLYTTLTRHVRAGRLSKRGKGYRVVQNAPKASRGSRGERGGVAPPVPVNP